MSAGQLLSGDVPAPMVSGRKVVIGASAIELRDFFVVPRYGILPGALLQILATQTLERGRALLTVGPLPVVALLCLFAIAALGLRRRLPLWSIVLAAVASAATIEAAALALQLRWALLIDTVPLHLGLAIVVAQFAAAELSKRADQKRAAEDRLRYLGTHDPVTGALNRTALGDLAHSKLKRGDEIAIILIDLRRFRAINDTLGHAQGDRLLTQAVERLRGLGPDAVARLGGDTFAMLVPAMTADRLSGYCQSIAAHLSFPYRLEGGHEATIAASAGATQSSVSGRDAGTLLSHADMALSAAKLAVGNSVVLFDPGMDKRLRERQTMDNALHAAIRGAGFAIAWQPQVDLATGAVIGAEALARWTDARLGVVPPGEFIAAAEETGQIVELGRWILEAACRQASTWPGHLRLAVNVSPVQFELSDVAGDIAAVLHRTGLSPARLDIEITEGVFVRNAAAVTAALDAIRAQGVGIALDDFGTGYSSLAYLGELPLDKIKIDQSFVRRLPADSEALAIVKAVLALSAAVNKIVVAEGIETEAQAGLLRAAGCQIGQGYLFGRPLAAADFLRLVTDNGAARSVA